MQNEHKKSHCRERIYPFRGTHECVPYTVLGYLCILLQPRYKIRKENLHTMDISILITQMTKLFIIIILGYIIFKIKLVDDNFIKKFTKLILNVTMPCMILASVIKVEERQPITDVLTGLITAAALFFIILPLLSLLLTYIMRVKKHQRGLYIFMGTYSNVAFMGMPVIEALCGSTGLFYTAIFNLMFNLSLFTLGVVMMNAGKENGAKLNIKALLTPGVLLSVLALVVYLINLKLPFIITDTINMVGSITSPSAMLLIGCPLAKMDIKKVFSNIRIYPWTLIKQIAIPLLLWVPLATVIKNETLLIVAYILTAMPVANTAVLFATNYDSDVDSASRGVFITTLFALITVPLCVLIV